MFAKIVMASVVLLAFSGSSAQSVKTGSDQNVSGTWTLNAEGYVLPMTLHQDVTRLTGTLQVTHGPFAISGEFKKGRIHFAGTSDGGGIRHDDDSNEIDVAAFGHLQPDGSLAGTMVSTVGICHETPTPAPPQQPKPGECVWTLVKAGRRFDCELRFQGESYGWECQVLEGGEIRYGQRLSRRPGSNGVHRPAHRGAALHS